MLKHTRLPKTYTLVSLFVAAALFQSSCTMSLTGQPDITPPPPALETSIATSTPVAMAETRFNVTLPSAIPEDGQLMLMVLDEVTGLAINPIFYPLNKIDDTHYGGNVALPLNGVVKYRYVLQNGLPIYEDTTFGQTVRYRMYYVPGPASLEDVVSSWKDQPFNGNYGRIQGQVVDTSGRPLVSILVTAGGAQAITDSLGNFMLDGLPSGTHNLVAYAMDGMYQTFQQGAIVVSGSNTPVQVSMQPASLVNVTFIASLPSDTVVGVPVRFAGNLLQLGNTFSDLDGGVSTVAARMPTLSPLADGRYSVTLSLPVGADITYKYTLGDGLWNAEHLSGGDFRLRHLVVPAQDVVVQDQVTTWQSGPSSPILFEVEVPADTPAGNVVYIQFNAYGWTEAVPMWSIGNNRWIYKVFSPLNMVGAFGYRYCRNAQCGSADDAATAGMVTPGRQVSTSVSPQTINDKVDAWQWAPQPLGQYPDSIINPRAAGFLTGIELQPSYDPDWLSFYAPAFASISADHSQWAILDPSWTVTRNSPLDFSLQPNNDPTWQDMLKISGGAHALGLTTALFPTPLFANFNDDWRVSPPSNWDEWFEAYRRFALYHADLATATSSQALILGGERIPASLYDGSSTADEKFRALLVEIRQHYSGAIYWAYPYSGILQTPPSFLDAVDGVYVVWDAPLSSDPAASTQDMAYEAGRLLDNDILPFAVSIQKPVTLAVAYPAAVGAASGCMPSPNGGCLDWMAFSRPNPDLSSAQLDLQGQANVYQAMFMAVNDRPWLGGFVSRGYYPPAALADKSASVNGKQAEYILRYWFAGFLGVQP